MKQSIPHTALMLTKYFKARSYQVNNGKNANGKTNAGDNQKYESINRDV